MSDSLKLKRLREIRRKNLEKNLLDEKHEIEKQLDVQEKS